MNDDFDFGGESNKLGGVPGVLRIKDGEEFTLVVTGPIKPVLDRFGDQAPKEKYALGVYVTDTRARGVIVLSWKGKKDWEQENEKRPFKTHFVRWGRVGSGQQNTRYNVSAFPGLTPAHMAEAKGAPALPLGSFDATIDEVKRRALEPREAAAPAAPAAEAAPTNGGHVPVPQPPRGSPAPAARGHVPAPAAPGAPAAAPNPAHLATLEKATGWLEAPNADVPAISNHAKPALLDLVGVTKLVELGTKHGIAKGQVPTAGQLHALICDVLDAVRPKAPVPAMAAGMGVDEDSIPF